MQAKNETYMKVYQQFCHSQQEILRLTTEMETYK